jgi:predicted NBD/HSP70 family sugar kinase
LVVTGTPRVLRAINDRSALELLLKHGPLSRSQLVKLTGLSKPTTGELLSRLLADDLVTLAGTTSGTRGPHAQLYDINSGLAHVAGVNAEEDRVSAAVADLTGRIVGEASVAANHASGDSAVGDNPVPTVQRALRNAARRAKQPVRSLHHVVVGVAGSFDASSDQVHYADDLSGWNSPGIVQHLRKALHVPLTIENDANLAAVAERTRGSAKEIDTFALLWVGRGLGLAVEFGGRLYRGATGGAGEVGYIPVAGPSATFQDAIGSEAVLELARRHGSGGTNPDAVLSADDDEPFLQELAKRLATCVATIVAVLDPPLVVLSGPTCQRGGDRLVSLTQAELHRISPFRTPLSVTRVSASPVLLGAVDTAVAQARSVIFRSVGAEPWMPAAPAPEASA